LVRRKFATVEGGSTSEVCDTKDPVPLTYPKYVFRDLWQVPVSCAPSARGGLQTCLLFTVASGLGWRDVHSSPSPTTRAMGGLRVFRPFPHHHCTIARAGKSWAGKRWACLPPRTPDTLIWPLVLAVTDKLRDLRATDTLGWSWNWNT
jgi:hypothetical protein